VVTTFSLILHTYNDDVNGYAARGGSLSPCDRVTDFDHQLIARMGAAYDCELFSLWNHTLKSHA
jgi:hypothetical protein